MKGKKILSTFLCLCMMVLTLMPMTAFADGTPVSINSIDITVNGYEVGGSITNTEITTTTKGLTVTPSGGWLDNQYNEVFGNFNRGQLYCHYVYLKAQDGYELGTITDDTIKDILKVNGKTPTTAWAWDVEDDGSVKILFFMDMLTETLSSLSLSVNNFEAGNTWVESNVIANSDNVWVQNAKLIYRGVESDHDVTVDEPMEAHKSYRLYLYIWTESGYVFDIATFEKEDVSISVNGQIVNPIAIRDGGDNGRSIVMDVNVPELHDYSGWQSNGNGTHTRTCQSQGCSATETADCSGGEATCLKKASCEVCGHEYGELAAHKLTYHEAKAATCDKEGCEAYWACEVCSKLFSDENGTMEISQPVSIPVTKHTPGAPATCTNDQTCTVCGAVLTEKLGHQEEKTEAKEPTETETGNIAYWYCERCGKYFKDEELTQEITKEQTVLAATGKPTEPTEPPKDKPETDSPQTGDNSNMALWFALMGVSAAGLSGVLLLQKSRRRKAK